MLLIHKVLAVHRDLALGKGVVVQQRGLIEAEEHLIELAFIFRTVDEIKNLDITRYLRVQLHEPGMPLEYWYDELSTSVPDDLTVIKPNNIPVESPGRWLLVDVIVEYSATATAGIGDGTIEGDFNAMDWSGHPYAIGSTLNILPNHVVICNNESGATYLWAGPKPALVGLNGTYISVNSDYLLLGTTLHELLTDVTPDQHHNQSHNHDGTDGSGQVVHSDLLGITPDNHHPQLHDLDSHTDVALEPSNYKEGQGLWYAGGQWRNRAAFEESWPTGLASGGELNIGPGINDIEVIAGLGVISNTYDDPLSPPVVVGVQWPQINEPITAAPAVAGSIVWLSIYNTNNPSTEDIGGTPIFIGALHQWAQPPGPTLAKQEIFLGVVLHNGVEWNEVSNPKVINQSAETLREFVSNVAGLSYIISGGAVIDIPSFMLEQEVGVIWENNRNWHVDKSNPNREELPALSPISFQYVNRDFTDVEAPITIVDPTRYDDGTGAPVSVPGPANTSTIQRLYLDPANNYWMLWGQYTYPNFLTAQANLSSDLAKTVIPFILQKSILMGSAIMEQAKTDWDPDEAVWIPAGGSAGAGGGGGTPITDHNNLNNIGPDDHHARMVAVGNYNEGTSYLRGDELYNGSDLSECLLDGTTSSPFVAPSGTPSYLYTGTGMANNAQLANQIIFGNRYINANQPFYISGYRVNVVAGNEYEIYSVNDPLGIPRSVLQNSFTATTTGWVEFAVTASIVPLNTLFDLVVIVHAPDPTPVEVTALYNYLTPQNPTVPIAGEIQHSRGDPAEMRISYTDDAAIDRTTVIQSLSIGDTITDGFLNWSVQSNTDMTTWAAIIVAPANTSSAAIKDFTFATEAPTPTSVPSDPAYWPTSQFPIVQGLIGVDVPYDQVTLDTNAYGVDLLWQPTYLPDPTEWRLKVIASTDSGSSGGGGQSGGGATESVITQAAHGFTELDAIRFNGAAWVKAQANDIGTTALGIVVAVNTPDQFTFAMSGRYELGALTADQWYYLDSAVAGGITTTEPNISQPIIYAEDGAWIIIYPYRPSYATSTEAAMIGEVRAVISIVSLNFGWHLADGTNGTEDLRGRSIFADGANGIVAGANGGALPVGGTSGTDGAHTHTLSMNTVGSHAHGINSDGSHTHTTTTVGAPTVTTVVQSGSGATVAGGGHGHGGVTTNGQNPSTHSHGSVTGSGGSHTPSGSALSNGDHTHTTPEGTLPPYYGMYLIQYTGVA